METDRKELDGALRALKGAVSSRPGIPALTGVLVEGDGAGVATLVATDLETTVTARIGAGGGSGFRALVPFKILAETVKASTSERVGLECVDGHVKVGGASIRLLPAEDFPKLAEPAELVGSVDAADLAEAIRAVVPAASGDEARPVLTGCLLEVAENGTAQLVATDSYRLHVSTAGSGWVRPGRYIIPARALAYVAKCIGRRPAYSRVAMHCSDGAVGFELGTVRLVVRLIEGEFPNWRQLIPDGDRDEDTVLTYEAGELEAALKAAEPFTGRTHLEGRPVRLELGAAGVRLSASAPDLGDWSATTSRVDVTGPGLTIAFHPAYLMGAVRAVGAGARMVVRDGLKPAVLTSADGRIRALVMPVRLPASVSTVPEPERPGRIHEPTAEERAGGEPVEDPTDPGAAERGEPAEVAEVAEPERFEPDDDGLMACPRCGKRLDFEAWRHHDCEAPGWKREPEPESEAEAPAEPEVPAVYPGTEDDRRAIRKANDDEPEPAEDAAAQWAELADIGTVAGAGRSAVRVRVVVGPDGSPMVDARRFVSSARYNGPTRKGFALRPGEAGTLAELLRDAQAAAEAL